jgi:hypothetical protein
LRRPAKVNDAEVGVLATLLVGDSMYEVFGILLFRSLVGCFPFVPTDESLLATSRVLDGVPERSSVLAKLSLRNSLLRERPLPFLADLSCDCALATLSLLSWTLLWRPLPRLVGVCSALLPAGALGSLLSVLLCLCNLTISIPVPSAITSHILLCDRLLSVDT